MWPLPTLSLKHIHIIIEPEAVSCYYITQQDEQLCPEAYEQYKLPPITTSIISNPTALKNAIFTFITTHHLQNSSCHIVLTAPLAQEQLLNHHNSYAQLHHLIEADSMIHYNHTYIGPDKDLFLFYVCGIPETLLLQLKMIFIQLPLHLQTISSPLNMQYECYKKIHGSHFNQTQLIQAIDKEKMMIKNILSSPLFQQQKRTIDKNLLYAIGSFIGSNR